MTTVRLMVLAAMLAIGTGASKGQEPKFKLVPEPVLLPAPTTTPQSTLKIQQGGFKMSVTVGGETRSIEKGGSKLTFKGDPKDLPAVLKASDDLRKQNAADFKDGLKDLAANPIRIEKTTVVTVPVPTPAPVTGSCCGGTGGGCACANQGPACGPFGTTYCRCATGTTCRDTCRCHRIRLNRCVAPTTLVCPTDAVTWFYHDYSSYRYYFYVDGRGNYWYWWRASWTRYPYAVALVP